MNGARVFDSPDEFLADYNAAAHLHAKRHTDILGAFVHGALVFGHTLGAVHNGLRGNRKWAAFHTGAALLDSFAVYIHWRAARDAR